MSWIPTLDKAEFERQGFVQSQTMIDPALIPQLHIAFEALFNGQFETGVVPDEVNWQYKDGDPALTRQICNGWKANRTIARVVLSEPLAASIGALCDWPGVRIMIDNVLWKPPGAKSLGFHQDSAFLDWFAPQDLVTCWIALDDTTAMGGTLEFASGSHTWPRLPPEGKFHAPDDYHLPMMKAAQAAGVNVEIVHVEVPPGGGSVHHGWTWHGSGLNSSSIPRRALVLHAMRSDVQYVPAKFQSGIGPIYSRYKRLADNDLDENYFPILWSKNGYRTPQIEDFLANARSE